MKSKQISRSRKAEIATTVQRKTLSTFLLLLQYTVYLKYRNSNPVKLQRPKCIPKVESTISQCVSCAPHAAHMPSLLQLLSSISRAVSYTVQTALFLLESSLSFPLLWFFLPTELFQPSHLLLKVLMLIPVEPKEAEFLHESVVGVVRGVPVVHLLLLGQGLLTEQLHHFHGFGVSWPDNITEYLGTQPGHPKGIAGNIGHLPRNGGHTQTQTDGPSSVYLCTGARFAFVSGALWRGGGRWSLEDAKESGDDAGREWRRDWP